MFDLSFVEREKKKQKKNVNGQNITTSRARALWHDILQHIIYARTFDDGHELIFMNFVRCGSSIIAISKRVSCAFTRAFLYYFIGNHFIRFDLLWTQSSVKLSVSSVAISRACVRNMDCARLRSSAAKIAPIKCSIILIDSISTAKNRLPTPTFFSMCNSSLGQQVIAFVRCGKLNVNWENFSNLFHRLRQSMDDERALACSVRNTSWTCIF